MERASAYSGRSFSCIRGAAQATEIKIRNPKLFLIGQTLTKDCGFRLLIFAAVRSRFFKFPERTASALARALGRPPFCSHRRTTGFALRDSGRIGEHSLHVRTAPRHPRSPVPQTPLGGDLLAADGRSRPRSNGTHDQNEMRTNVPALFVRSENYFEVIVAGKFLCWSLVVRMGAEGIDVPDGVFQNDENAKMKAWVGKWGQPCRTSSIFQL